VSGGSAHRHKRRVTEIVGVTISRFESSDRFFGRRRLAGAAQKLAEAIRTAERHPDNHLVRQLALVLEPLITTSHESDDDLVPLFARLDAGSQLTSAEGETLLRVAVDEERYMRIGKE
jgi:hypothetical protein